MPPATVNATCYSVDGNESSDIPCGFSNLSTCCGSGWDCLSNGLCQQHGTTAYSQSTCTNQNYENCLSFCNKSQFEGFTEVSRCAANGNSWCCAGAAGQGLGGTNCCDTNLTTSLEPYPFSTLDNSDQATAASSSLSSSTFSISSGTTLTSTTSSPSSPTTSVQSTSQTPAATSTRLSVTPSMTSTGSPSPQPTAQSHNSKIGIEVGITVAVVVVLLAVLAFFIFQNRKFRRRLLQVGKQTGQGSLEPGVTRPEMQEHQGDLLGELDVTHYELTQQDAPKHEVLGNEIHEIYHNDNPEYELAGDSPPR